MVLFIGFLVLLLILLLVAHFVKGKPTTLDGISGRPILSPAELAFYHQLCTALPQCHVFPQVAVNAMLEVDKRLPRPRQTSLRNKYSQWHVDFVVCEKDTLEVIGIVEFDGKRHSVRKDAMRDTLLAQGGYCVHRFKAKSYTSQEIAARFQIMRQVAPDLGQF